MRLNKGAFYNCSSLTRIEIPSGVTSIGGSAFRSCSSLTRIEIPSSVTSIGILAFENCRKLTAVYITDIDAWCQIKFSGSNSNPLYYAHNLYLNGKLVTDANISDGVASIGRYSFCGCSSLTSIAIPSSVTSIGVSAFYNCSKLKYNEYDNAKYLGNTENPYVALIKAKNTSITDCTINDSTKVIGDYAFWDCRSLTSTEIPNSVTSIGDFAFGNCWKLASIAFGDNSQLTTIGEYAFGNCSELASITIPSSVTSIGKAACCGKLTSIKIYSKTAEIYDSESTISNTAIIYGFKGSTVEAYAKKYNRQFIPLEEIGCNHTFECKYNEISHWDECKFCGEKKDIVAHIFDNACDTTCDTCGYTRSITHNYEQKHDETNHWLECSVCHEKKDEAAHTFRQRFDKTHHWNECSCGFIKDKSEHTLDEEGKCTECRFGRVMLGDLNGDGKISAIDLTLMRKYIAGYKVDMIEAAADLNGDGGITAVDLTMLRKYIAGLITEF